MPGPGAVGHLQRLHAKEAGLLLELGDAQGFPSHGLGDGAPPFGFDGARKDRMLGRCVAMAYQAAR